MDHPANEIEAVIKTLCQGSAHEQDEALHKYFLPDASFIHPLCFVPRFSNIAVPFFGSINSLWLIQCIYRWYITFAPKLDMIVGSTAFDEKNNLLYANCQQTFSIWFVPFYRVTVKLVVVLELEKRHSRLVRDGSKSPDVNADAEVTNGASAPKYYIAMQQDHYQLNYVLEFVLPHLGARLWVLVQSFTTFVCMLMSILTLPLHFYLNPDTKRQKVKQ